MKSYVMPLPEEVAGDEEGNLLAGRMARRRCSAGGALRASRRQSKELSIPALTCLVSGH